MQNESFFLWCLKRTLCSKSSILGIQKKVLVRFALKSTSYWYNNCESKLNYLVQPALVNAIAYIKNSK